MKQNCKYCVNYNLDNIYNFVLGGVGGPLDGASDDRSLLSGANSTFIYQGYKDLLPKTPMTELLPV